MEQKQILDAAIQHHMAGRLDAAEKLYRDLLAEDPNQPDALHLIGVITLQEQRAHEARALFKQALWVKPNFPEAHNNMGTALKALDKLDDAEASYRQAISQKPDFADAHYNLGTVLDDMKRYEEAAAAYRMALSIKPKYLAALGNLASVWVKLERFDEAIEHYHRALEIEPDYVQAHLNLGHLYKRVDRIYDAVTSFEKVSLLNPETANIFLYLGQTLQRSDELEKAEVAYRQALEVKPDCAETYFGLGQLYYLKEQMDGCITYYQKSLTLNPQSAETYANLGLAFHDIGNTAEALKCYREALNLNPELATAHFNLGNEFQHQQRFDEALECYEKALEIEPAFVRAINNTGTTLQSMGRLDEAIDHYRKAISIEPDYAEAHNNLGNAFFDLGNPDQAIESYKSAIEHNPDFTGAYSNWLLAEHYRPGHTVASLYKLHRGWDEKFGAPLQPSWQKFPNSVNPERQIRIGFVSADLGRHPVGYFVVGLFENLQGFGIETICYSDRVADDQTNRIKEAVNLWRDIRGKSDEEVASMVHEDEVDILFDLAGHSGKNRLPVFVRKPAPVQVSWAGYVGTTGLSAIDYLLSDHISTRSDEEKYYSEKIIYMPDQWLCYEPPSYAPDVNSLPFDRNGYVTFGSFSNPGKINKEVISVWAQILAAVDGSQLVLKYRRLDSAPNIKRLSDGFEAQGIDPSRLILEGRSPHPDLLARYHDIDIALDPFPYSGGLTTYEALWMGVPVITATGNTFASRHSESHLKTIGFPEFVASSSVEYAERAIDLANNSETLNTVRRHLRQKMAASPTCDHRTFARNFAFQMRGIWKDWCATNDDGHADDRL